MLINLTGAIISLCICISNDHVVHLKHIHFYEKNFKKQVKFQKS